MQIFKRDKFDSNKCRTALQGVILRARIRQNKQQELISKHNTEIATLLRDNKVDRARVKASQSAQDEAIVNVLDLLQTLCEHLMQRVKQIDNERFCPGDVIGIVHSILYCESRIDFAELTDFMKQIEFKYGRDWVADAANNRKRMVNTKIVALLCATQLDSNDIETRLQAISEKYQVKWVSPILSKQVEAKLLATMANAPRMGNAIPAKPYPGASPNNDFGDYGNHQRAAFAYGQQLASPDMNTVGSPLNMGIPAPMQDRSPSPNGYLYPPPHSPTVASPPRMNYVNPMHFNRSPNATEAADPFRFSPIDVGGSKEAGAFPSVHRTPTPTRGRGGWNAAGYDAEPAHGHPPSPGFPPSPGLADFVPTPQRPRQGSDLLTRLQLLKTPDNHPRI